MTPTQRKNENKGKPIGTNNNNKSAATQSKPLIAIPSWTRLLVFFGIYLLVLGLLKTVEYFSEGLQKIEGSLDLKSMGYSSDPPEIEVFELIEKMGSEEEPHISSCNLLINFFLFQFIALSIVIFG
ncbi:hypothetical protein C9374_004377 [Naegleria lovaniensis]|uniref:Uncharacterized protein n=1 Tax=Naegleria lovaniensis TaxID=51637 RepID=A0AA88KPG0_NAELO|nr:uncharacterized protein C9374_004377 [Naegleria lovaniensis]KAG2383706.1 hypothetical protein C9374_004377 [Naegleria lovaniensis]